MRETVLWKIIYFKLYKSQTPVMGAGDGDRRLNAGNGQIWGLLPGDEYGAGEQAKVSKRLRLSFRVGSQPHNLTGIKE